LKRTTEKSRRFLRDNPLPRRDESEALASLTVVLNLTRADVQGVVSFYHDFRRENAGRYVVKMCRAEACRSMGTEALAQHIEAHTGCRFDAEHHDGAAVELESVYCLGQCALSPALMLNGTLHAKVTPQKFDTLFAAANKCVEVTA
jgi:formate dehydrogenase subunit gamma